MSYHYEKWDSLYLGGFSEKEIIDSIHKTRLRDTVRSILQYNRDHDGASPAQHDVEPELPDTANDDFPYNFTYMYKHLKVKPTDLKNALISEGILVEIECNWWATESWATTIITYVDDSGSVEMRFNEEVLIEMQIYFE